MTLVCLVQFASPAEDAKEAKKSPEQTQLTLNERNRAIEGELAKIKDHPWAGEYYHGDGTGVNITVSLAPTNGFTFRWDGCLGAYGRNFGTVEVQNGWLQLSPARPNEAKPFCDLSMPFVPVGWGQRKYLVATNQMIQFCNAINGGFEPRDSAWGMFLLKKGDEKKTVTGRPELPEQYRKFLLKKPIVVAITKISDAKINPKDDTFKEFTIELDSGSEQELFPGMELHFQDEDYFGFIEVKTFTGKSAEAILNAYGKDEKMPKVGLKLTTLPPWRMKK